MSQTYRDRRGYRFGEFTLDLQRGGLFRNGSLVPLRPKSFDVLRYLVERQGTLVSRNELLDELWAGTVVTDESVTQCLIDIRKALGDGSQTMIRTVPRRGYVFEQPVEALRRKTGSKTASARQPATASRAWSRGIPAVAVIVGVTAALLILKVPRGPEQDELRSIDDAGRKPSIAIMPFESMSQDVSQSYFADGVSEEIINSLARQRGLKVIARTSSFSFRGQNADVAEIARQLDVSHVLEGSVRKEADAFRINVQLVDADTGEYVWTEQFDRELSATSVFAIQSEIATAVVHSLRSELSPEERSRIIRVPTENTAALEDYFEARQLMETRRPIELQRAADLLRNAIDRDPEFALAYIALADTLRLQSHYGSLPSWVADDQGITLVQTALSIDDRLGEAYASLGNIQARRGDYQGAESSFLRGIELSPSYAPLYQWYGQFLWVFVARPDEGVSYSRIAAALDPRSAIINTDYAGALAAAGRYEESLAQLDVVHDIDPQFARGYLDRGILMSAAFGDIVEAVSQFEKARSYSPEYSAPLKYLFQAHIDLGLPELARELLDDSSMPRDAFTATPLLQLHLLSGETEDALRHAEFVLELRPWHIETLRYLRDHELAQSGVDAAIDIYRPVFADLLGEAPDVVGPSNFAVAIDVAYLMVLAGRRDRAEELLKDCMKFIEGRPRHTWFGTPIADVRIQAILGNNEEALSALRAAVDQGWRWNWQFELEHDLALTELREKPEYEAVLQTIRADMRRQRQSLGAGTDATGDGE